MPSLTEVLGLVRDCREHLEAGRLSSVGILLEAIEDDLAQLADAELADQRHSPASNSL